MTDLVTPAIRLLLPERFWSKTVIQDTGYETPCLLWTGGIDGKGYGYFWVDGKHRLAHGVAYRAVIGPVPNGLQPDHLCRQRACVNWDHLEPVTSRENTLRGAGPAALNARKTHCPHGHAYDDANTYWQPWRNGVIRQCRACKRMRQREYRQRKRAARS